MLFSNLIHHGKGKQPGIDRQECCL